MSEDLQAQLRRQVRQRKHRQELRDNVAQRDEFAAWLKSLGIDPATCYRVLIDLRADRPSELTAFCYATDSEGHFHLADPNDTFSGVAEMPPKTIPIRSLPSVPELSEEWTRETWLHPDRETSEEREAQG